MLQELQESLQTRLRGNLGIDTTTQTFVRFPVPSLLSLPLLLSP